jgi:hypothetical protein
MVRVGVYNLYWSTYGGGEQVAGTLAAHLAAWRRLAQDAGGEAPLPETPDLSRVAEIDSRSGNDQLVSMASQKDDIAAEIGAWKTLAERRESRLAIWSLAERLLTHAEDLPGTTEIRTELDAINAQRSLLAETDPVAPVLHRLAEIARGALHDRHQTLTNAITESHAALETDATWTALDGSGRKTILDRVSLAVPAPLSVSGDNELATTLDRRPLDAWEAEIAAVDQRRLDALAAAAKTRQQADPAIVTTTVAVDRGTLADEPAVRAWIDAQEKKLLDAVKTGPVIVR